jgi:hypothetical protein
MIGEKQNKYFESKSVLMMGMVVLLSKRYLKHQEGIHFMNNIILHQELSVANTILGSISGLPVEKYCPGYKKLLEVVHCY